MIDDENDDDFKVDPDEYRSLASEAQEQSDAEADPRMKAAHLERAAQWEDLALTADVQVQMEEAVQEAKAKEEK